MSKTNYVGRLWLSEEGKKYRASGYYGEQRIYLFPNTKREGKKDPDYSIVFFTEDEEDSAAQVNAEFDKAAEETSKQQQEL